MYALIGYPAHLRGLFTYLSATLGDGLLLPIAFGALIFAYSLTAKIQHGLAIRLVGFAIGAGLGAATQVTWLLDDHPQLNWTLPRPHHFNVAGIYHAAFLAIVSGLFGSLWFTVLLRLATGSTEKVSRRDAWIAVFVAMLASLLFVVCLILDNHSAITTTAGLASVATILLGVLGITALAIIVLIGRSRSSRARFRSD
jgi:hypothetical protein